MTEKDWEAFEQLPKEEQQEWIESWEADYAIEEQKSSFVE